MFKIFFLIFLSVSQLFQGEEYPTKEEEIEKIEKVIQKLQAEKNKWEKQVAGHESRGSSLQFNKGNFLESRREYFLADQEQDRLQLLDLKIKKFTMQKKELLEE